MSSPAVPPDPTGWMHRSDDGEQMRAGHAAAVARRHRALSSEPQFVPAPPPPRPPQMGGMYPGDDGPVWQGRSQGVPETLRSPSGASPGNIVNVPPQDAAEQVTPAPVVHSGTVALEGKVAATHGAGTKVGILRSKTPLSPPPAPGWTGETDAAANRAVQETILGQRNSIAAVNSSPLAAPVALEPVLPEGDTPVQPKGRASARPRKATGRPKATIRARKRPARPKSRLVIRDKQQLIQYSN